MNLSWIKIMRGLCMISAICVTICFCLFLDNGEHIHERAGLGGLTSNEDFITHPKRISIGGNDIICEMNDPTEIEQVLLEDAMSSNEDFIAHPKRVLDSIDKNIISENQEKMLDSIDKDIISKNQESLLKINEAMSEKNYIKKISEMNKALEIDQILSKVDNSIIHDVSFCLNA
jgi:hypothetical protein